MFIIDCTICKIIFGWTQYHTLLDNFALFCTVGHYEHKNNFLVADLMMPIKNTCNLVDHPLQQNPFFSNKSH